MDFLNDAFLSIVSHTERPDHLHVRARLPGDIERTFPSAAVTETPTADYRSRGPAGPAPFASVVAHKRRVAVLWRVGGRQLRQRGPFRS